MDQIKNETKVGGPPDRRLWIYTFFIISKCFLWFLYVFFVFSAPAALSLDLYH